MSLAENAKIFFSARFLVVLYLFVLIFWPLGVRAGGCGVNGGCGRSKAKISWKVYGNSPSIDGFSGRISFGNDEEKSFSGTVGGLEPLFLEGEAEADTKGFSFAVTLDDARDGLLVGIAPPCGAIAVEISGVRIELSETPVTYDFFGHSVGTVNNYEWVVASSDEILFRGIKYDWDVDSGGDPYAGSLFKGFKRYVKFIFDDEKEGAEDGTPGLGSFHANWSIPGELGKGGCDVEWHSDSLSGVALLSSVNFYLSDFDAERIPESGGKKQVKLLNNGMVEASESSGVLTLSFYDEGSVGAKDGGGFYTIIGVALKATVVDSSGSSVLYKQYENGVLLKEWELSELSGPTAFSILDVESEIKFLKTKDLDPDGNRRITDEIWDLSSVPAALNERSIRIRRDFDWGWETIAEIEGTDGLEKTTSYNYYDNELADGDNYKHLARVINSDGSWERYEYDDQGRQVKVVSGYLNGGPNAADNQSRVLTKSWSSSSGVTTETRITTIVSQEVAREYTIKKDDGTETKEVVCTVVGAAANASTNLVTTTKYSSGKISSVQNPDGTMTLYYSSVDMGEVTNVEWTGEPNSGGTAIVAGTKTTRVEDEDGKLLTGEQRDIASNLVLESYEVASWDAKNRPTEIEYSDGTTEEKTYGAHGVTGEKTRQGEEFTYTYYGDGKRETETRRGITTIYAYDDDGNLETITRKGTDNSEIIVEANTYDAYGERDSSEDAIGNVTTYAEITDVDGQRISTTTLPSLATRVETYYRDGQLKSVSGTGAHPFKYEYGQTSAGWQFVKEVKVGSLGEETEWVKTYSDLAGRSVKVEYPDSSEETLTYNPLGQLATQTDPDGITRVFSYNGQGQMLEQGIDLNGNGIADSSDRLVKTVKSVLPAHSEAVVLRSVTSEASETGYVTVSTVDQTYNGSKQWESRFGIETSSTTTYTGGGDYTQLTTLPDESTVTREYDNGRLVSEQKKIGSTPVGTTTYQYDPHGRLWKSIDGRTGTQTVTTYYDNDKPHTVSAGSMVTTYEYNAAGQPNLITKPGSRTSTYLYWPTGRIKEVGGTSEYPVNYTYDSQGRMKTMVTSSGTTTWNYHPSRGWLSGKTDADNKTVSYSFTPAGRQYTRTWARGVVTTYGYDPDSGDLASQIYSDGTPTVTYEYDQRGRPDVITDAAGTHTLDINDAGQLVSDTISGSGPLNGVVSSASYDSLLRKDGFTVTRGASTLSETGYTYDGASRLDLVTTGTQSAKYGYLPNSGLVETITFKQGSSTVMTTTKGHDSLDRLESVSMATSSATHSYTALYNAAGQREKITLENGQYWSYGYNSRGEVVSGEKKLPGGTNLLGYQKGYTFDDIGNRLTSVDNGRTSVYTPNSVNEYSQRTVPGYVNVVGQALADTSVTINGGAATRQGTAYHRELEVDNSNDPIYEAASVSGTRGSYTANREGNIFVPKTPETFSYDDDGNLVSDGRWNYSWNGENRLIGMETSLSADATGVHRKRLTFEYDYVGRRISKKVENWRNTFYAPHYNMLFVYDGWNLATELLPNGQKVRSYIWGSDLSGRQVAGGIGGLLFIAQHSEGQVYVPGFDLTGNVCRLYDVNNVGTQVAFYEYGPFGEILVESGPFSLVNPVRWSSKYMDLETGSVYYGHRYLSCTNGRWISRDPAEERGGLNLYSFCYNSSLTYVDPLGLTPIGKGCCSEEEIDKISSEYTKKASNKTAADPGNREFGGLICCKGGKVKATQPHGGPAPTRIAFPSGAVRIVSATVDPHWDAVNNRKVSCADVFWFGGWEEVAVYHSHPDNSPFSDEDKNLADREEIPIYKGTPDGNVERYDPDPNYQGGASGSGGKGPVKLIP